jgi:lysophospholipase L1-like esterase
MSVQTSSSVVRNPDIVVGSGLPSRARRMALISTRHRIPTNQSASSIPSSMSRSYHVTTQAADEIEITLVNWLVRGSGNATIDGQEVGPGGPGTFKVSVEYPEGTITPVGTVTIPDGGEAVLTAKVALPANAIYWVRIFQTNPLGVIMTLGADGDPSKDGYVGTGATDLTGGGTVAAMGNTIYRPALVRAMSSGEVACMVGDSIMKGEGDSFDGAGDVGIVSRLVLAQNMAYINMGIGADRAAWYTTQSTKRRALAAKASPTVIYDNLGINDILNSAAFTTVRDSIIANRALWADPIRYIRVALTPPNTTSTDFFATAANQTVNTGRLAIRNQVNAFLYNAPKVASSVLSVAAIETAEGSGIWLPAPTGRTVTDISTTAGVDSMTSASAALTGMDDWVPVRLLTAGPSGGALQGFLRYNNSPTVAKLVSAAGNNLAANTAVTGGTAVIGAYYTTPDGTHLKAMACRRLARAWGAMK